MAAVALCKEATGIVKEIIYDDANDAPGVPACVIVDFGKSFTRPSCFEEGCVPINPRTEQCETVHGAKDTNTTHSRIMIQLRLSYAWTI